METVWYTLSAKNTADFLESDDNLGINHVQVDQRQKQYGFNELQEQKGTTIWGMFFSQFKEFLVLLLIAAAAVSLAIGETTEAIVILAVVLLNAVLGVIQEYRAEKSLAALKTLSAPTAKVVREGAVFVIPARELVPGDLILLEAGDYIPADARLVETAGLTVDESALTGESIPVEKDAAFVSEEPLPLANRNPVHMGIIAPAAGAGSGHHYRNECRNWPNCRMIQTAPIETRCRKSWTTAAVWGCLLLFSAPWSLFCVLRESKFYRMFLPGQPAVPVSPRGYQPSSPSLWQWVQRMARQQAIIRNSRQWKL